MKLDGKALAQAMMRRKQNEEVKKESEEGAEKDQLEKGSHIAEMSYFAECLHKGEHEKAHEHLSNMVKKMAMKDEKEEY